NTSKARINDRCMSINAQMNALVSELLFLGANRWNVTVDDIVRVEKNINDVLSDRGRDLEFKSRIFLSEQIANFDIFKNNNNRSAGVARPIYKLFSRSD